MNKKKNYRNPNQRAEDYLQILLKGKIKRIHVTKRNNSKEEREEVIQILMNSLSIMGIETIRSGHYFLPIQEEPRRTQGGTLTGRLPSSVVLVSPQALLK